MSGRCASVVRGMSFGTTEAIAAVAVVAAGAAIYVGTMLLGQSAAMLVVMPLVLAVVAVAGLVLLYACFGSPAALIAFLFVAIFVNDALFRVREPGDLGLDWQNALKLGLWAGAAAVGVVHLPRSWRMLARPMPAILLSYLGIALVSSIYSAAPSYSFGTAFGMLSLMLLAAASFVTLTEKQFLLTFALSLCAFVVAGWGVYFAIPELGRSPFITADGAIIERICGLAGQANALGCTLATLLGVLFLLWWRGHCGLLTVAPMAAVATGTLLAADSRTALLAVMVGVAAVVARRSLLLWGASLLAVSLASILVLGVPARYLLGLTSGLSRSGDGGELLTLTGRTEIWAFVWERIKEAPWFGYGYNSSKFILPLFHGLPGLIVDEAHNTWLQNLLGTGIFGTAPLLALVAAQVAAYVVAPDPFRDLFLFVMLVWGITVAGAFGSTPTVMSLAVFASHVSTAAPRRSRFPASVSAPSPAALRPRSV